MDVRNSYDSAAEAYAYHLASELTRKPLDRPIFSIGLQKTREAAAWWPISGAALDTWRAICTIRA